MNKRKRHKVKEELERIKKEKGLTASNVVDEAKGEDNPLHDEFEWDDKKAGRKWREQQARVLIVTVDVEKVGDQRVSNYLNVNVSKESDEENKREYKTQVEVAENESWREQILRQAVSRIKHWQTKYKHLEELSPIFRGIDEVEEKLDKKKKKSEDKEKVAA